MTPTSKPHSLIKPCSSVDAGVARVGSEIGGVKVSAFLTFPVPTSGFEERYELLDPTEKIKALLNIQILKFASYFQIV